MLAAKSDNHHVSILHIEDNADNRLLIRRILNADGYNVIEADSAAQALRLLVDQTPDLILIDINMPDMDGYTLTSRLKSQPQWRHIPVIAITANALKGDRERSLQAGCDGYIQKPIDVDNLTEQVLQFLQPRA